MPCVAVEKISKQEERRKRINSVEPVLNTRAVRGKIA